MKRWIYLLLLAAGSLQANPGQSKPGVVGAQNLQYTVSTMRNELSNHEDEITVMTERLNNLELTIELLRDSSLKDQGSVSQSMQSMIERLERTTNTLVNDLQKLRSHANEMSDTMGKTANRLVQMEKTIQSQNQNIGNLQSALKSVLEAFNMKDSGSVAATAGTYKVKSGDSLEKIAKKHSTTVAKIKELNDLTKDQIRVGQNLKIP